MIEWIDRKQLSANTGGDAELAAEVLEIFKGQIDTWGQMLVAKEPAERWADAAHTIKGASLGIGALQLAEACKACEIRGRAEKAPSETEAALLINDIRDAMYPTLEEVAKIIHEISVSGRFRAS